VGNPSAYFGIVSMGGACNTFGEDEMLLQGFVEETEVKSPLLRHRRGWEDCIQMDVQEVD